MIHTAPPFRTHVHMLVGAILLHGTVMVLNEVFFRRAEFLQGIGWIYIPAGTRLLCTLLFGWAGAIGLLIAGWVATYWYYFPGDAVRATAGAIASTAGPCMVYLIAKHQLGLRPTLTNLNPQRLLLCALGCAVASPLLHHLWFMLQGEGDLSLGFFVMFIGDLAGTVIVLCAAKAVLTLNERNARVR